MKSWHNNRCVSWTGLHFAWELFTGRKMNTFLRITALLTLAALPAAAASFTINNTGGAADGSADPNWLVNGGTAYVVANRPPPWLANSVASGWISPGANYGPGIPRSTPGAYTYETTFDLTGLNPNSATLSFVVAADDQLTDVLLNGMSQGINYVGFNAFSGLFTINSDFIAGVNTIEFLTLNGLTVLNPTGLRVEFSNATANVIADAPEPSSIALFGIGTLLLFARRFRKTK